MNDSHATRSNDDDNHHHHVDTTEFSPTSPPVVVRESTASIPPQRVADHPLMMASSLSSNHHQSNHSNRNQSGHSILGPPSSTVAATIPTEEATVLLLETPMSPHQSLYDDRTTYAFHESQMMNGGGGGGDNHHHHDSIRQETASLSDQTSLQMHHSHRGDDHDARYAATLNEEEELLLALKISAYECQRPTIRYHTPGSDTYSTVDRHGAHDPYAPPPPTDPYSWSSSHDHNEAQQATVVEISAHFDDHDRRATTTTTTSSISPFYMSAMGGTTSTTTNPRMGDDTVRAEWIGSSSVATTTTESPASSNMIYATAAAATTTTPSVAMLNDQHNDNDETYYEVAVIDSAPMEKQDETIVYTEEARIVDIREQNDDNQDNMEDDRKPAAIRRPKKKTSSNHSDSHIQEPPLLHPPQNGFHNGPLPVISERPEATMPPPQPPPLRGDMAATAQVVSIQMESDLHPLLRRTTESDSEAELVGLDHTFYGAAAAARNLDDGSSMDQNYHHRATSVEPNQIVTSTSINGANQAVDILSIQDEDTIHPSDLDAIEALNNDSTTTTNAELIGSMNYMDVNDNALANRQIPSVADNSYLLAFSSSSCIDTSVVSTIVAEQEGDVVAIRDEDEVHPLEFDENAVESTTSAELIGSINPLNLDSMAYHELADTTSAVALAVVTEPSTTAGRADVVLAESSIPDETVNEPVIVATAFTDPHQPLVETLNEGDDDAPWGVNADEEIARTLQEEEDVARTFQESLHAAEILQDEDVARQLQNSTEDNNHVDAAIIDRNGDSSQPENVQPDLVHVSQIATPIQANEGSVVAAAVSTPKPHQLHQTTREVSHDYSTTSENTATSSNLTNSLSNSIGRGTTIVLEALFGDLSPLGLRRPNTSDTEHVRHIVPRTLLPCSVMHNPSTKMWVATIQTNQRALDEKNVAEASKSLRAFTMPSERQARSLAQSWTPPRMHRFTDFRSCHICQARFALLRRACHCRNCGVSICKDCCVSWPAKMIPDTYNFKKESMVNACRSCDWLSTSFRLALLRGDHDRAISLFSTGNVNLHTPFANVKGELFYPVHCAVLGGNLDVLKFLVDENCCPIRSIRVGGSSKEAFNKVIPIVTSKGRSLLGIAMEGENLNIVRYLVAEKGLSLSNEKDLTPELLCRNFEKLLRMAPDDLFVPVDGGGGGGTTMMDVDEASLLRPAVSTSGSNSHTPTMAALESNSNSSSISHTNDPTNTNALSPLPPESSSSSIVPPTDPVMGAPPPMPGRAGMERRRSSLGPATNQECIICCDHVIDCVATPCGHAVCCLGCGLQLNVCPVCNGTATFIKIFRA